ncbi:MAG: carbohydrate-binding protein [Bacteroidetes bacterium]|nr:carbohydrate-binding protein [Bacteroidota bacterium]
MITAGVGAGLREAGGAGVPGVGVLGACTRQAASTPWQGKPQEIPGRVECELYDEGGEGVAYHDSDAVNHGSGMLNPANGSFLNEFRMREGVDISYTKTGGIDDNPYNFVKPEMGKLYVGWTVPGEWTNYTVKVKRSGMYRVGLMYTANRDAEIRLDLDGKDVTGPLGARSTYQPADTVAWRQWHHWNKVDTLGVLPLEKGVHVLRLYTVSGNMNYDYLEFNWLGKAH